MQNKIDLDKETMVADQPEVYKGMKHKFVIAIKDLEGTCLHPDYDWSSHLSSYYSYDFDDED